MPSPTGRGGEGRSVRNEVVNFDTEGVGDLLGRVQSWRIVPVLDPRKGGRRDSGFDREPELRPFPRVAEFPDPQFHASYRKGDYTRNAYPSVLALTYRGC